MTRDVFASAARSASVLMPGSYDPVTIGHLSVIEQTSRHFERVHVIVFRNPDKRYLFTEEERRHFLALACAHLSNVEVGISDGYVADYARERNLRYIVKGVRDARDRRYEEEMAAFNKARYPGADTLLVPCAEEMREISSSRVRAALASGEPIDRLVPASVADALLAAFRKKDGKD